jgi:hypothetical protein
MRRYTYIYREKEKTKHLGKPRRGWEDFIKMNIKKTGLENGVVKDRLQ